MNSQLQLEHQMTSLAGATSSNAITDTDLWFAALDHQPIEVAGRMWTVEVVGMHACENGVWIQARRAGSDDNSVVLLIRPGVSPSQVLASIAARLARVPRGGDVIDALESFTRV
jgi:hypothetical protein